MTGQAGRRPPRERSGARSGGGRTAARRDERDPLDDVIEAAKRGTKADDDEASDDGEAGDDVEATDGTMMIETGTSGRGAGTPLGTAAVFEALERVAVGIAGQIPVDVARVWIVPDDRADHHRSVADVVNDRLRLFERVLDELVTLLKSNPVAEEAPGSGRDARNARRPANANARRGDEDAPSAADEVAQTAASLEFAVRDRVSLPRFHSADTTVEGPGVRIGFPELAGAVSDQLNRRSSGVSCIVNVAGAGTPVDSTLSRRVAELGRKRDHARNTVDAYRARHLGGRSADHDQVTARLEGLRTVLGARSGSAPMNEVTQLLQRVEATAVELASMERVRANHELMIDAAAATVAAADQFIEELGRSDDVGLTPLSAASQYVAHGGHHVLLLRPVAATPGRGGPDEGLGTTAASFLLTGQAGDVVASGTIEVTVTARRSAGDEIVYT